MKSNFEDKNKDQDVVNDFTDSDEEVQELFDESVEKDESVSSEIVETPKPVEKKTRIAICPQCGAKASAYLIGTANKCSNCSNWVTFLAG